jgi:hypothetical protein
VQSVYADGKFVSYIRIAGDGQIRENGNKPIDDTGLRLADRVDLHQFQDKFSRLEAEYQKRTGQVVTAHQEQDITGQKALSDDPVTPPTGSLRHSFAQALHASKTIMGGQAKLYAAETFKGNYRGEIIAQTDLHVVQRLNDSSAVAHMTHMLSPIPRKGSRVQIQYSEKDFARCRDIREHSAAENGAARAGSSQETGEQQEIAKESSRFVARFEPGSGTVGVHDKRLGNDHHSPIDLSLTDKANGNNGKPASELKESFQEARALAVKELGQEAKTYVAQTRSGVYYGKIIGETDHHLVQRVSGQTAVAHLKKLVAETPRIDSNVSIAYQDDKARVRNLPERSRAAEIAR